MPGYHDHGRVMHPGVSYVCFDFCVHKILSMLLFLSLGPLLPWTLRTVPHFFFLALSCLHVVQLLTVYLDVDRYE